MFGIFKPSRYYQAKILANQMFWYFLFSLTASILFFILRGDHGSGDGAINVIYASNLESYGRLEFNFLHPSTGASSPTWTLLISLIATFVGREYLFLGTELLAILLFSLGCSCAAYYGLKKHSNLMGWLLLSIYFIINLRSLALGLQWEDGLLSTISFSLFLMVLFFKSKLTLTKIFYLSVLATFVFLTRNQNIVPLALVSIYFVLVNWRECKEYYVPIIIGALTTSILSSLYFIWCYLYTGNFLPYSVKARYQLKDSFYEISPDILQTFLYGFLDPLILFLPVICIALMMVNKNIDRQFCFKITLYLISSIILFYVTSGFNYPRYSIAFKAIVFIACADYLITIINAHSLSRIRINVIQGVFLIFIVISSLAKPGNGYSWQDITLADKCDARNEVAINSAIMLHEVQNRWCLDNSIKVIAMDGIIDGIMTPAIKNPDIIPIILRKNNVEFIELYAALADRHFIGQSVIGRAAQAIILEKNNNYTENNIIFMRVSGIDDPNHALVSISFQDKI